MRLASILHRNTHKHWLLRACSPTEREVEGLSLPHRSKCGFILCLTSPIISQDGFQRTIARECELKTSLMKADDDFFVSSELG